MKTEDYKLWNPFTDIESFLPYINLGPMKICRGEGSYVYNERGEKFINAASGLWNVSLGHGRREIISAVTEQMETLAYASCFRQTHPKAMELAERLCRITAGRYDKVYLGSNGTEATEAAIKMARQYFAQHTGTAERHKILSFRGSYHGVSIASITASGEGKYLQRHGPGVQGMISVVPPDSYKGAYGTFDKKECEGKCLERIEQIVEEENANTIAAFIVEPVMGENGILDISDEFMNRLVEFCHEKGILFIADEVTTGFGRTGRYFATEEWKNIPDILCLGKGISSGYLPLSATLATERVYEAFKGEGREFLHGSTASGHPACAAAGLATMDIMEKENVVAQARETGRKLYDKLIALQDRREIIGDVRGRGMMIGIELVEDRKTREPLSERKMFNIVADAAAQGMLLYYDKNVIGLFPPLTISDEVADAMITILDTAFDSSKLGKLAQTNRLAKMMIRANV